MNSGLVFHVMAGTKMFKQGADGGWRGDLNQGSMAGVSILKFVSLHLSALKCSTNLDAWVQLWWNEDLGDLQTLSPEGWFDEGQREDCFL
jgi:hypothetical protein